MTAIEAKGGVTRGLQGTSELSIYSGLIHVAGRPARRMATGTTVIRRYCRAP
jgi:hypothetical protein